VRDTLLDRARNPRHDVDMTETIVAMDLKRDRRQLKALMLASVMLALAVLAAKFGYLREIDTNDAHVSTLGRLLGQ
jgi:hypothetical protein